MGDCGLGRLTVIGATDGQRGRGLAEVGPGRQDSDRRLELCDGWKWEEANHTISGKARVPLPAAPH